MKPFLTTPAQYFARMLMAVVFGVFIERQYTIQLPTAVLLTLLSVLGLVMLLEPRWRKPVEHP